MHWDNTYIAGVGTAYGDPLTTTDAVRAGMCRSDVAVASGQVSVSVAGEDTSPADLAAKAARIAIRRAALYGEAPEDSFGPLFSASQFDMATSLYAALHLPPTSHPVTTISTGRHGVIHGLAAAAAYLPHTDGTLIENALVTAAAMWPAWRFDLKRFTEFMPFGDGGAAVVISRRPARAQLLSTTTRTDPVLHRMRRTTGHKHEIARRASHLVELTLTEALEDAPLAGEKVRYVITPFGPSTLPRTVYRSWAISSDEQLAPFIEHGRTIGHLGAADLICGLDLLDSTLAPIDDGDFVVLLADDGDASAAAAVIRF